MALPEISPVATSAVNGVLGSTVPFTAIAIAAPMPAEMLML